MAHRFADGGFDAGAVAGNVAGYGGKMEQRDAQIAGTFGAADRRVAEAACARQMEAVLLAQCLDHRGVGGFADQLTNTAVTAGVGGAWRRRAGDDDDAVGACAGGLGLLGVAAGHLEVFQCGGLAFGDGDQAAGQRCVAECDVGQQQDVDGAGGFLFGLRPFDIGTGIDAGADGVAAGAGGG